VIFLEGIPQSGQHYYKKKRRKVKADNCNLKNKYAAASFVRKKNFLKTFTGKNLPFPLLFYILIHQQFVTFLHLPLL